MFPAKSKNNRPKLRGFYLKRGSLSVKYHLMAALVEVGIPYLDNDGNIKYTAKIEVGGAKKVTSIGIYAHRLENEKVQYLQLSTKPFEGNIADVYRDAGLSLQYADLRHIEQVIKDTENGLIPFDPQ